MIRRNPTLLIALIVLLAGAAAWYNFGRSSNAGSNNTKNTTEFTFKELGVKVALPQNLKGLSYDTSDQTAKPTPPLIMRLKINSFTTLVNQCFKEPPTSYQNFATLIKQTGNYDSNPYHLGEKVKQFSNYYIADVGSSLPKDLKCVDASKTAAVRKLNQELHQSLIESFK